MSAEIEGFLHALRDWPEDQGALTALYDALVVEPPNARTQDLLRHAREFHGQVGDWSLVAALLDAELAANAEDVVPWRELAQIARDHLLDLETTRKALEKAERLGDEAVSSELEELEEVAANWQAIAERYRQEASSADPDLASGLRLAAAELIGRHDQKDETFEKALLDVVSDAATPLSASCDRAYQHLSSYYRHEQRWNDLAEVLLARRDGARTDREKARLSLALGDLRLGAWGNTEALDEDQAIEAFREVLQHEPANLRAFSVLTEVLERREAWAELAKLRERAAYGLRGRPRMENARALGALLADKLDQPEDAERYFDQVRAEDPTDAEALRFFRKYHGEGERWPALVKVLEAAQRASQDAQVRGELLGELADLTESKLGQIDRAVDLWKALHKLESSDRSYSELARLYRISRPPKWYALRELLKQRLESLADNEADQKLELLQQVVELYQEHLKQPAMVVKTLVQMLEIRSDHRPAQEALAGCYESMGKWSELTALLESQAEQTSAGREKVALLYRVADLRRERMGNKRAAVAPLAAILEIDPSEAKARETLLGIHRERRDWHSLLALYDDGLRAIDGSDEERAQVLRDMAEIAQRRLSDPARAIELWNRVLACAPNDQQAVEQLRQLYRRESRFLELAAILQRLLGLAEEDDKRFDLNVKLAELYTDRLRDESLATQYWAAAGELRPEHSKTQTVLKELLVRQQRWDELEQLFLRRQRAGELVETLVSAADRESDDQARVALYLRAGGVAGDQLGNRDRATKAYERALAVDERCHAALEALVDLYRAGERWNRLIATYERLIAAAAAERKREYIDQLRHLVEDRLGSKQLAFQWGIEAYRLGPASAENGGEEADQSLDDDLKRLADAADGWDELFDAYAERLKGYSGEQAETFLAKLAALAEDKQLLERACKFYEELADAAGNPDQALASLERLYQRRAQWEPLCKTLNRKIGRSEQPQQRVELWQQIAQISEERLGDIEAAIAAHEAVLSDDADSAASLENLERLYALRGDWAALARVMSRRLDLAEGDARVALLYRLGDVHAGRLDRVDEAIDFFATALERDGQHEQTIAALERLFSKAESFQDRIAPLLYPVYKGTEAYARLASVLERLVADPSAKRRPEYQRELRDLYRDHLKQPVDAFAIQRDLFLVEPGTLESYRELVDLGVAAERGEELAATLEQGLSQVDAGSEAEAALRWELACVLDGVLGSAAAAERHVWRLLRLGEPRQEAFEMLERILREHGKWNDLLDLLRLRLETASEETQKLEVLQQICSLCEDVINDAPSAIAAHEQILELRPHDADSLRALERYYRNSSAWPQLAEVLATRSRIADGDEERQRVDIARAELAASRMEDVPGALDLLRSVVEASDPPNHGAVLLLEELLDDETHRASTAEVLESVHRRTENWSKLANALELRAELSDDPLQQAHLLSEMARVYEDELEDTEAALQALERSLLADPTATVTYDQLDALLEKQGGWERGARIWQAVLDGVPDEDIGLRIRLLERIALTQQRRGDRQLACETYEKLAVLAEGDPAAWNRTSMALIHLYSLERAWEPLAAALQSRLEQLVDDAEREDLLDRIASIQRDRLEQPEAAATTYERVLEVAPQSASACFALEELYPQLGRWDDLVELLQRQLNAADDKAERQRLLRSMAETYERQLEDGDRAGDSYRQLLALDPADQIAATKLRRVLRQGESWEDLHALLEERLGLADDADRALVNEIRFELAELELGPLAQPSQALPRLAQVIDDDREHAPAIAAVEGLTTDDGLWSEACEVLSPLYYESSNWEGLVRINQIQADHAEGESKLDLLVVLGSLCSDRLGDHGRAFDYYREALDLAPDHRDLEQIAANLWNATKSTGRWDGLVGALESVAPNVSSPALQRQFLSEAAQLAAKRLDDRPRAMRLQRSLLELDPDEATAIAGLETWAREEEDWETVLELARRKIDLASEQTERHRLLVESASICREKLEDNERAIALYEEVYDEREDHRAAIAALTELYPLVNRWDALRTLLWRQSKLAGAGRRRKDLLKEIATLSIEHLEDESAAFDAYEQLLELDTTDQAATDFLEGRLEDPELGERAAKALEPIFVAKQRWQNLLDLYKKRHANARDEREEREASFRIARLYEEQLEDLGHAFEWYGKVFLINPDDQNVRDELARLATVKDSWEALAGCYADAIEISEGDLRRRLRIEVVDIHVERLGRWEPAQRQLSAQLAEDSHDREVFAQLVAVLERFERWHELLEVFDRQYDELEESAERQELLFRRAEVYRDRLENADQAIVTYKRIMVEFGDLPPAIRALDNLYQDTGRWADLVELLEHRIANADEPEHTVGFHHRAGQLLEEHLEDLDRAIDAYEQALSIEPTHRLSIEALERLVLKRGHRSRILGLLEPLYRAEDEWAKLVVVLEAKLEFLDADGAKADALAEVAVLHEQRGATPDLAFDALGRAYALDPSPETLVGLERLAGELNRFGDLVGLLHRVAEDTDDILAKGALLRRAAQLADSELEPAVATAAWKRLFALQEDDDEAQLALVRLLEAAGAYQDLVPVLRARVEHCEDIELRVASGSRLAEVYDAELGEPDIAIDCWRQVLDLEPDSPQALRALHRLLRTRERWRELIEVCRRRGELADKTSRWVDMQREVADLYETALNDSFAAVAVLKELLERVPGDIKTLDELDRLYSREGLWSDVVDTLEVKLEGLRDAYGRSREDDPVAQPLARQIDALDFRIGAILLNEVGDFEGGLRRLQRVLDVTPTHPAAIHQVERILEETAQRDAAAAVLSGAYETTERWKDLIRVVSIRADVAEDPEVRARFLRRAAHLERDKHDDLSTAMDLLGNAVRSLPEAGELRAEYEGAAATLGRERDMAELYEALALELHDETLRRHVHLKLAEQYEVFGSDEDLEKAEAHYRRALECGGDERQPLESLDRLLAATDRYRDLADILERRIAHADGGRERATLLYRIGELERNHLEQPTRALDYYRDALEEQADYEDVITAVRALLDDAGLAPAADQLLTVTYRDAERHADWVELIERRVQRLGDPTEQALELSAKADIQLKHLGDSSGAIASLGRAVGLDPDDDGRLDQIEKIAEARSLWSDAVEAVAPALEQQTGPEALERVGLRVGGWQRDALKDDQAAERSYRRVLEARADSEAGLSALDAIYRERSEWSSLAEILGRRADIDSGDGRLALLRELAQLQEQKLDDADAAIATWYLVVADGPGQVEGLRALSRLLDAAERYDDLARNLDRLAQVEEGPERAAVFFRLATLQRDRLENVDAAISAFQDVLDLDGDHIDALVALEQIYTGQENWGRVAEMLQRQRDALTGDARRDAHRRLGAVLAERLEDYDDAIGVYAAWLEESPEDQEPFEKLVALYRKAERYRDLADLYGGVAKRAAEQDQVPRATALLRSSAATLSDDLDDYDAALERLEEARDLDDTDQNTLLALARCYERLSRNEACKTVLEQVEAMEVAPQQAAEIAVRLGKLELADDNAEGARKRFEQALSHGPNMEAAQAMADIARDAEDWPTVASMVVLQAEAPETGEAARLDLWREVGRTARDHTGDEAMAKRAWGEVLERANDDAEALEELARLQLMADDLDAAEALLARLLQRLGQRRSRKMGQCNKLLAEVALRRGDSEAALEHFEKAYRINSADGELLVQLGKLYFEAERWDDSRRIYRSLLLQRTQQELSISRAEVCLRLGNVHKALGETSRAKSMYERGLEDEPGHQGLVEALSGLEAAD